MNDYNRTKSAVTDLDPNKMFQLQVTITWFDSTSKLTQ